MNKPIYIFCCLVFFSCNNDVKFDKSKWLQVEDLRKYPYRQSLLNDLTTNYKLIGLSYQKLVDLLGEPDKWIIGDSNQIYYPILTEFGSDVDPVHSIHLVIKLSQDSIVKDFKIEEWKK